jgi:hypothetical protein
MSSPLYALTCQHSMNIGFRENLGFGANVLFALTPLAAIFSNSRSAGAGIGSWHWNRIQYALEGMGSKKKLTKFSMGHYFQERGCMAFGEFINHCLGRVELVKYSEGTKNSPDMIWPELRARVSQSWLMSPRMSWIRLDGKLSIWVEARALDAQPTLVDGIALDLLMAGNVSYWFNRGIDDVNQLMSFDEVEPTTMKIAKAGPYHFNSKVTWNGREYRAVNWVLDCLIPNALTGIKEDNLCELAWAENLLSVLKRTLSRKLTGSDWIMSRSFKSFNAGQPEGTAIARALQDMAQIQNDYNPDFDNPCGLVDLR